MQSGRLRADLYYRLNVLSIELPALRERPEDVRAFARAFLAEAARELSRPEAELSESVLERFERYPWPGNVRELKNLIRRLVATAETFPITLADLPPAIDGDPRARPRRGADESGSPTADQELLMAVVASARTMAEAAARLGITRSTLYRRMERFGLRPERILRPH